MAERRNTIQQEIVAQTLRQMHDHPTADAIYIEICNKHSSISRATVFRILNRMAEEGRILRISNAGGGDRFDYEIEKHYHVQCKKCGRISNVSMKKFPALEEEIECSYGYRIIGHTLLFEGICEECDKSVVENDTDAADC
ncbi:transcriptional repressor [Kineothrix sedimenti]|jgi:Fe2+ or Zn2+ uptake regulation protein|uniref:Transcriptional repressor n=1 Tax=Kineothrix sedimenti TaxID=3123317 RepID=A0ABZ3EY90_9FIRM